MGIDVIDLVDMAHKEKRRKNIFDTPRFHAWMHYYKPGQKDEMHCHNADQTFVVLDGECTMSFPDGGQVTLKPGQAALITGGSFTTYPVACQSRSRVNPPTAVERFVSRS